MGWNDHADEDGDTREEFLAELIEDGHLSPTAAGITRLVIDKGEDNLSPKQQMVYDQQVKQKFLDRVCSRCGCEIPGSELSEALENDWLCSWCAKMVSNDD